MTMTFDDDDNRSGGWRLSPVVRVSVRRSASWSGSQRHYPTDSGAEFGSRHRSGSVRSEWSISDAVRVNSVNRFNSVNSDNASQLSSVRVNTVGTGQTVRVGYEAVRVDSVKPDQLSESTRRVNLVHVSTSRCKKIW